MNRKLKSEIAKAMVQEGGEPEGWTWVAEVEGDHRRWEQSMQAIIKSPDGRLYSIFWSRGLTENQDNTYPWGDRYDTNPPAEINIYEVEAVEVTTIQYRMKR